MADPLYRRIADDLRAQIETGQFEPGSQLPSGEKLGELFRASRNTIRDAIKFLISLGLVETRAGQGTFVVDPPDPLVTTLTTKEPGRGEGVVLDNEDIEEGTVEYLKGTLGLTQVGYRDWITVRAPKNDAVGFFGLPPDGRVPVFEIFRTAFDQNGKPMRVTVTIFPADRQQFIIDVGKVPAPHCEPAKRPA